MEGLRPEWAVKVILVILLTSVFFRCVSAANHTVGGSSGWDLSADLQSWTAKSTFHVGDSLVFCYTPAHDVLEVNEMDFERCHTLDPIKAYNDGDTVIQLNQIGFRYFMCGREGHCGMGLKLRVHVLPQKHLVGNQASSSSSSSNSNATHRSSGASDNHRNSNQSPMRPQRRHANHHNARPRHRRTLPPILSSVMNNSATSETKRSVGDYYYGYGSTSGTGGNFTNFGSIDLKFLLALSCVAISLVFDMWIFHPLRYS